MNITLPKDILLEKLNLASRFTSSKLSTSTALQGILMKAQDNMLHLYSTNLSAYFHTSLKLNTEAMFDITIEPRKIIEFLNFLNMGDVSIEVKDKSISIAQGKTKGAFPLMVVEDFPTPPSITEKDVHLETNFLVKHVPLVLFASSRDETRPVLTGVNFVSSDEELLMVSTDGFRLSLMKDKSQSQIPSMIIPSDFLNELVRNAKDEKEVLFSFSQEEKIARFVVGENEFFTRLIDGEFPPFERVIPVESKTKIIVDREELLRNVKLIAVFARDFSNVVVCDFKKDGLYMRPKKEGNEENTTFQEVEMEGEEQKVAFNFKFLLDLLGHINTETITIEVLRSDAPIVFKLKDHTGFLHIIMPVRIQE